MSDELRTQWEQATAALPFGVQRVFKDVLDLVAEGTKTDLIYGTDYSEGGACLVNASANLLTTGGGKGIPMKHFGDVVDLFDRINVMLYNKDVNTSPSKVSPLAAEILSMWFAPLKEIPDLTLKVSFDLDSDTQNVIPLPYMEPSDASMEEAFMTLLSARPVATPWDVVEPVKHEV